MQFFVLSLVFMAIMVSAHLRVFLEHDARAVPSKNWALTSRADPKESMTLYFMMRHEAHDVQHLEELLFAVSDPRSYKYGKHRSIEELGELAPISLFKLEAVKIFLEGTGAKMQLNPNRDIIKVKLSVGAAEKLFATKVSVFTHVTKNVRLLRASAPHSVPADLAEAVSVIGDLAALPRLSTSIKSQTPVGGGTWTNDCNGLSGCQGLVTPGVIKQRYSVPESDVGMTAKNNSFSVAEFQGQYYKPSDLVEFSKGCNVNVTVEHLIGGNQDSAGIEAELDIEYIKAISPKIPLTVIYGAQFSLLDWVNQISSMEDAPWVHSVSYGNDEKQQTSAAYMDSCNVQFMKAGIRGMSIMFASGDQGVCGREGCAGHFLQGSRFKPDFPAGSPYITAVGGTDFAGSVIGDEMAWTDSGGGFSDHFAIPDYQREFVSAYKSNSAAQLPLSTLYNNTGRGYPDISALGGQKAPYCVVANGGATGVAGTSASCPTAASIFARLNGLRLANGKPTLGFLNPFIYQNSQAFNDVKLGNNKCYCSQGMQGFTAIQGWDPVTGVGTPNFAALSKLV